MKRYVAIWIIISMLLLISACSKNPQTTDISNSPTSLPETASQGYEWPTEKWSTSTPEAQSMDASILSQSEKKIEENYPNIYSVLVVKNGYLVYEKYYNGANTGSSNPVYSVTKSVMSALTGIAINKNLIRSIDQKAAEFLPEYFKQIDDTRKKEITIKNILTMSGGLESIDSNYYGYFTSKDYIAYALGKPLINNIGEKFDYNTGLSHLLSGIITESSDMNTSEFANKYLFEPLGIDGSIWDMAGGGYYGGGAGLYLKPRDMAKLGYLYLNKGKWDGAQIIPEEWVEETKTKQISVEPGVDYGYLFWLYNNRAKINEKTYFSYAATGAGGQYIMIVPDLDLVAVITANENRRSKDNSDTQQIIWDYIIPSVIIGEQGEANQTDSAENIINEQASKAVRALKDKDMETLSKLIHPDKGVRFSPYAYVDVENDLVFKSSDVMNLNSDSKVYKWGSFDGIGDPIELSFEDNYKLFIYDVDFANAEKVGYNEILGRGNTLENSAEVYKNSIIVEYHFSGIDPQNEGMDWRSLRIAFEKVDDTWYIVGIIHDQWTI